MNINAVYYGTKLPARYALGRTQPSVSAEELIDRSPVTFHESTFTYRLQSTVNGKENVTSLK